MGLRNQSGGGAGGGGGGSGVGEVWLAVIRRALCGPGRLLLFLELLLLKAALLLTELGPTVLEPDLVEQRDGVNKWVKEANKNFSSDS